MARAASALPAKKTIQPELPGKRWPSPLSSPQHDGRIDERELRLQAVGVAAGGEGVRGADVDVGVPEELAVCGVRVIENGAPGEHEGGHEGERKDGTQVRRNSDAHSNAILLPHPLMLGSEISRRNTSFVGSRIWRSQMRTPPIICRNESDRRHRWTGLKVRFAERALRREGRTSGW